MWLTLTARRETGPPSSAAGLCDSSATLVFPLIGKEIERVYAYICVYIHIYRLKVSTVRDPPWYVSPWKAEATPLWCLFEGMIMLVRVSYCRVLMVCCVLYSGTNHMGPPAHLAELVQKWSVVWRSKLVNAC